MAAARSNATAPRCAIHDLPVRDATICRECVASLETDLGDVAALTHEMRVFSTDGRTKGEDADPLVRSRARRQVWTVDPVTGESVLAPEPLASGEFGRASGAPWDAERGLGREIDVTVSRQGNVGRGGGLVTDAERRSCPDCAGVGRRAGMPSHDPRSRCRSCRGSGVMPASAKTSALPFDDRASKVADAAHATLGTWVRDLHDGVERWPADDVTAFAVWLLARTARIAQHPAAVEIERDVHRVVAALRRAVDRAPARWFMGPCDVEDCVEEQVLVDDEGRSRVVRRATELYAEPDAETVMCRRCGTEYDVDERRAWLLAAAEDQLAHAELIGRAAPALGLEITPSAIRNYADRGRIIAHGVDGQGHPLYRVGDVIDVARDVLARRAQRADRLSGGSSKRSA